MRSFSKKNDFDRFTFSFFSSPSKSPSKRKRDSIALLNLDEELKKAADAKKRTSDYINNAKEAEDRDADHEHNLASIVASLRYTFMMSYKDYL